MYSGLTLGKKEENLELNFRVKIACSKHPKEYVVNFCKTPACAHNPLSCYKCLADTPDHLTKHHEDITPIHEYLYTLMYAMVNGLIDKSDILNSNEMEFQKSSFQKTREMISREKASCELFLNDFKYSIMKEVDNIKYAILQFYDKYNDDLKKSYDNYTSCFEKGKGQEMLTKYGDLKKTLEKFNKVSSDKAMKIIEDIKFQQESVKKAKSHLKGFHEMLSTSYENFKTFHQFDDIEADKIKASVMKPIINLNEEICKYLKTNIRGIWGDNNASLTSSVIFKPEKESPKPVIENPDTKPVSSNTFPIKALKQPESTKQAPEEYMKNTEIDLIYDI